MGLLARGSLVSGVARRLPGTAVVAVPGARRTRQVSTPCWVLPFNQLSANVRYGERV